MLGEVIDQMKIEKKTVFLIDIGCSLLAWDYFNLATSQTHHGRTIPTAIGYKMAKPEAIVIAYLGDGGAYAIGLQHTLSACLHNQPITAIVVNNTLYAMTGGQSAPTTVDKEITTTTPAGKKDFLTLKGPELLKTLASPEAYLARGVVSKPLVLKQYLRKALEAQIKGHFALVEALSACPTNWQTDAPQTLAYLKELEKIFVAKEF
jgi:2-oxoglutarate ferredoxin oxidoreductase subunit beta